MPQQIAAGDIYPALEKGTIDAAEWVGPYDDEKLGFEKVAQNYYYPGLVGRRRRGSQLRSISTKWNALPKTYQSDPGSGRRRCLKGWMIGKYDTLNPPALKRLVAQRRATARRSRSRSWRRASRPRNEVYAETRQTNPMFKKVLRQPDSPFRNDAYLWWQVAE